MDIFTLLVAIIALVVAIMAFQRTGGIHDLRNQMEELSSKSDQAAKGARDMTADALGRLENFIRGQQNSSSLEEKPSTSQPPPMENKP